MEEEQLQPQQARRSKEEFILQEKQKLNKTYKEAMGRLQDANGAAAQPDPERRRQ